MDPPKRLVPESLLRPLDSLSARDRDVGTLPYRGFFEKDFRRPEQSSFKVSPRRQPADSKGSSPLEQIFSPVCLVSRFVVAGLPFSSLVKSGGFRRVPAPLLLTLSFCRRGCLRASVVDYLGCVFGRVERIPSGAVFLFTRIAWQAPGLSLGFLLSAFSCSIRRFLLLMPSCQTELSLVISFEVVLLLIFIQSFFTMKFFNGVLFPFL